MPESCLGDIWSCMEHVGMLGRSMVLYRALNQGSKRLFNVKGYENLAAMGFIHKGGIIK